MFATIIIVLPTTHTGGEARVVHGGEEKTFDYASTSQFNTSVLAWYADILHEVKPITSGHRLALSYNLIQPNWTPATLPSPGLSTKLKLGKIFSDWSKGAFGTPPSFVCYLLKHEYDMTYLWRGVDSLNAVDVRKIAQIKQAAEGLGICFGLGQFVLRIVVENDEDDYGYGRPYHKRRKYNCYYDEYGEDEDVSEDEDEDVDEDEDNSEEVDEGGNGEEIERSKAVFGLVDLDGDVVLTADKIIRVDGANTVLIPEDAFRGVKPNRVERGGYRGNVSQLSLLLCLSMLTTACRQAQASINVCLFLSVSSK